MASVALRPEAFAELLIEHFVDDLPSLLERENVSCRVMNGPMLKPQTTSFDAFSIVRHDNVSFILLAANSISLAAAGGDFGGQKLFQLHGEVIIVDVLCSAGNGPLSFRASEQVEGSHPRVNGRLHSFVELGKRIRHRRYQVKVRLVLIIQSF